MSEKNDGTLCISVNCYAISSTLFLPFIRVFMGTQMHLIVKLLFSQLSTISSKVYQTKPLKGLITN